MSRTTAYGGLKSEAIRTEARRIARNMVKQELKAQGIKVSYVEASQISKAVRYLLAIEPEIINKARREIRRRSRLKAQT